MALLAGGVVGSILALLPGVFDRGWMIWRLFPALLIFRLICLVILGLPVWLFLHHTNRHNWPTMMFFGAWIPFVLALLIQTSGLDGQTNGKLSAATGTVRIWVDGQLTQAGWKRALNASLRSAGNGALVGLAIWAVAYRRKPAKPALNDGVI